MKNVVLGSYHAPEVTKTCIQTEGLLCTSDEVDIIVIDSHVDEYITIDDMEITFD